MIEIIKLVAEVGIITVAAGLFLWRANKQEEERIKREEEDRKNREIQRNLDRQDRLLREQEQRETYDLLLKEILHGRHNADKEEEITNIEKQINSILKEILYSTNAGRAYFIRYHNGGHDLNNLSFLKMSMTNEVTRQGISSAMNSFTNQFRAIFPWLVDSIAQGSPVHINEVIKLKTVDHTLYEYMKLQNIERAHGICIKNAYNQIVGFIAISYLTSEVFLENEKIAEILKLNQAKLETVLQIISNK